LIRPTLKLISLGFTAEEIAGILSEDKSEHIPYNAEADDDDLTMQYVPPESLFLSEGVIGYVQPENVEYLELEFPKSAAVFLVDPPTMQKDEVAVMRIYKTGARNIVVERSDDLLTPQEVLENREAVKAAMLKELLTWHSFKCFSRKRRSESRNIIDSRWVLKWKYVKADKAAETSKVGRATAGCPSVLVAGHGSGDGLSTSSFTSSRIKERLCCPGCHFKKTHAECIQCHLRHVPRRL